MIKKVIFALTTSLLLCGCDSSDMFSNSPPNFDRSYTATAKIDYGEFSTACDITRSGSNDWCFNFTQPDYLMGMDLKLADGDITASLGEINVTVPDIGAYHSVPDMIAQAVDSLTAINSSSITENEGILTINTEVNGNKVIVTADKNGNLISLKCPKHKLAVEFGDQLELVPPDELDTLETEEVSIIFDE